MAEPIPLLGLLPTGHPLITVPTSQPTPTSFLYVIPSTTPTNPKPFSHLAVFLLPGIVLPLDTAAAIYLATNPEALITQGAGPEFRFLGGVGPGKESAIFKVGGGAEGVVIGIGIEGSASVAERIEALAASSSGGGGLTKGDNSKDSGKQLVKAGTVGQPSTLVLAQRIIQNAFNFLSGFSGQAGQVEVVPLKAFEDWWRKFESKVRSDPTFLERGQDC